MKTWYDVMYTGRLKDHGVTKEVRAAMSSAYFDWTAEKLQAAMRDKGQQNDPGMAGLEITGLKQISPPSKNDTTYDRFVDLDQLLGI